MNKKIYEDLDTIKKTIGDTKYVLDDARPCNGIKKVLLIWLVSFSLSHLLLFIYVKFSLFYNFFGTELYYQIYRISHIGLLALSFIIYQFYSNKLSMTVKEKDFLRGFMIYPLFLSFFKALNSISFYINTNVMVLLYDTIPFDLIIAFMAIFQIYRYFNEKYFLYLSICLMIFIALFTFIKIVSFNMSDVNMLIVSINNLVDIINLYSIIPILLLGISIFFMKENLYG